jgi:hypothetical protein
VKDRGVSPRHSLFLKAERMKRPLNRFAAVVAAVGVAGVVAAATARLVDKYTAVCDDRSLGTHAGPWFGPERTTRAAAQADAKKHKAKYSSHNPFVLP